MNGGLWREHLPWREPELVVEAVARHVGSQGLVWLDGDGSDLGRWGRLGFAPQASICCRGLPGAALGEDPFAALAQLEEQLHSSTIHSSWMGWLAYEAGAWVEPGGHWKDPAMAVLWAAGFSHELVFDLQQRQLWLEARSGVTKQQELLETLRSLIAALPLEPPGVADHPDAANGPEGIGRQWQWQWHTDRSQFADQVEQIRRWIAAGDLFQANLTSCCETILPASRASRGDEALMLYRQLRRHCPAPFGGLAIGCDQAAGEAVLCSSPERFLQRHPDGLVETRPIKGTRPRHQDQRADGLAAAELVSSPKDRAENVMIVDLLRNDLGRVCQPGSIHVPQLVGLESYRQVHHLTSVIEGRIPVDLGIATLLQACWPGGSISGAPKIRACQRLGELEPVARGAYCGSLFRLGHDGSFDSNIIIRSLLLKDRSLRAHAGCGIVADSDPEGEADEMGWKIEPLLSALA
ncbi:MAG: anthranilate synthase component I family protein [Cyanobacteria bacterium M_surface_9_m1_291]|nr:anthranilate synthase component I family protein [Cyanobacteria bacterium K_Offshore_0m_m2_072]MBM5808596.1 anthranilate synthase component I family protein [Cyanobacteria bacterium M_surface_9_m1_291]